MLTKAVKRRKLSHEILGITFLCLLISVTLCWALWGCASVLVSYIYEANGITPTDIDISVTNNWVLSLSVVVSAVFFAIFFLIVLGERLVYIRKISHAIHSFDDTENELILPLEGSNELTDIAQTINLMSRRNRQIREKEKKLNNERQELVRSLSHDIRTPLTSVMSYSQLLLSMEEVQGEAREYADNIYRKSLQIKEITDILLDTRKNDNKFGSFSIGIYGSFGFGRNVLGAYVPDQKQHSKKSIYVYLGCIGIIPCRFGIYDQHGSFPLYGLYSLCYSDHRYGGGPL